MSPLWTKARDVIRTLFHACGEPQAIARQGYISRKVYDLFLAWIRAGETLLRRMLLIEAHAINVPPASCRQPSAGWKPAVRRITFDPDQPDNWRVSFRCTSSSPASGGSADPGAKPGEAKGEVAFSPPIHATRTLALRAEALLRICNNPAPYITRLARLIARTRAVIARILKPPHQRKRRSGDPPHQCDIIGREFFSELCAACPNTS